MSRKTVNVEDLKIRINEVLAKSTCSADRRQGQIDVLTEVLMDSRNYHGFTYLMHDEVPDCELPGILVEGTIENTPPERRFPEGRVDRTRVRFF